MKTPIKAGSKVIVVEGMHQGETGVVTSLARQYDEGSMRWNVWFDNDKGHKIKTRLSWIREL